MTRVQSEVLRLLDEVDGICEDIGVDYYLVGLLLLLSKRNMPMRGYSADIAMTYDDFLKFRKHVEEKYVGTREFESIDNNPDMTEVYYRYVNSDTLLFDLENIGEFRCHGVALNILIIRNDSRDQKILQKIESVLARSKKRKRRKVIAIMGFCWNLLPSGIRRSIMNRLFRGARTVDLKKRTRIKLPGNKAISLPGKFWKKSSFTTVEGHEYRTVGDAELYLNKAFGESWMRRMPKHKRETYMTATSTEIPYRDFLDMAPVKEIDREFLKKRERYLRSSEKNAPLNREIRASWNVMFGTEKRIQLMEQYLPQKERIMKTWNEGYHDDAMLMLEDYRRESDYFSARGYALWIDEDIWNIHLKWLEENGEENKVEKLIEQLKPRGNAFANN